MRRLSLKTKPRLIGVSRSVEKRQEKREAKAEIAAKLTSKNLLNLNLLKIKLVNTAAKNKRIAIIIFIKKLESVL